MSHAKLQLWSNSPFLRFRAAKKYSDAGAKFSRRLVTSAPGGKWPFGMPSSINPWLLVMGISPGRGEHDSNFDGRIPTVGTVHPGFEWHGSFWRKIRCLCFGLINRTDTRLKSESECLAVSGLLNLGIKNQGLGGFDATDPKIRKWIPKAIEMLKPRVVVLLGWKSLFCDLRKCWNETCFPGIVVHSKPDEIVELSIKRKSRNWFQIWIARTSWGKVTVILWPQHPSRCPFNDEDKWKKSVKQASILLKKKK